MPLVEPASLTCHVPCWSFVVKLTTVWVPSLHVITATMLELLEVHDPLPRGICSWNRSPARTRTSFRAG